MMRLQGRFFSLVLCAASVAFGADKSPDAKVTTDDKKGVQINEIERGFYFEARGGYWATFNPPTLTGGKSYFSSGQAVELDMGFDIGERFSPSLFLLATGNRMGSDYTGYSNGIASGDYGSFIPGVGLKVRLVGFKDAQEVERTWFYVRVGAGVMFYSPSALINKLDVLVNAGPGIEYFTKLRHFSIGLEANFNFMALTSSFGFSVLPMVKYSF
jgi:hypothetical protein